MAEKENLKEKRSKNKKDAVMTFGAESDELHERIIKEMKRLMNIKGETVSVTGTKHKRNLV